MGTHGEPRVDEKNLTENAELTVSSDVAASSWPCDPDTHFSRFGESIEKTCDHISFG